MNLLQLLRFIDCHAPARILTVSGSGWSDRHNAAILLALGQGYLTLTDDGLILSAAGRAQLDEHNAAVIAAWRAHEDARNL